MTQNPRARNGFFEEDSCTISTGWREVEKGPKALPCRLLRHKRSRSYADGVGSASKP